MPELPQRAEGRGPAKGLSVASALLGGAMQAASIAAVFFAAGRSAHLFAPAVALLVGCLVVAVMAEAASQRGSDPPLDRSANGVVDRSLATVTGLGLLLLWLCALLGVDPTVPIGPRHISGATMILAGTALRCASVRALGRRFVTAARPSGWLEVSGIYRWLRHPSETGLLSMAAGAASFVDSVVPWVVLGIVLVPVTLLRVRREDRELARAFGAEHRRYAASVGALLPRLWYSGPEVRIGMPGARRQHPRT